MKLELNIADRLDVEIGARVRHVRKTRGLSQTELGASLGVTFQQIQKYERGANRISSSALILLARVLEVSPGTLLGVEDQNAPELDWALLLEDGAHELMQVMSQIRSPKDRRAVVELVRALAEIRPTCRA